MSATLYKYSNRSVFSLNKDLFDGLASLIHNDKQPTSVVVPHVCNNIDVFGGGFAAVVGQQYPVVQENYHLLGQSFLQKNPGYCQFVSVAENKKLKTQLIFANMIAQDGIMSKANSRPLNYLSLIRAMVQVSTFIRKNFDKDRPVEIHAPKFGSGLAGGNWNFIAYLIDDVWEDFNVYIYDNRHAKNRS